MDTARYNLPSGVSTPLVFRKDEVEALFDERGRFQIKRLRQRQAEKALQIVLRDCHSTVTTWPEEVHRYVTLTHFSMVKARRMRRGFYLLSIEYRYQGEMWRHVFRFERDVREGLSGRLYFVSWRRVVH